MKRLQLSIFVRDVRTNARSELTFVRSPVMVGRQARNGVRLDAATVSRQHGEFRFGTGGVRYIDLESTNGTYLDGVQIEPNAALELRESSVIDIVPYQMVVHGDLVPRRRMAARSRAKTLPNRLPLSRMPLAKWSTDLANSTSMQRLFIQHGPVALFRRATAALEILATLVRGAEAANMLPESPLRSFASSAEFVAHLIDPAGEEQRLEDLRDLLAGLLHSTQTIFPEGTS